MITPLARSVAAWFRGKTPERQTASKLYGAIVTQSRDPVFYADWGVPDTPDGRYDVIVLHLFLVMERLNAAGAEGRDMAQHLVEAFVEDMDDSMREMGVGDLTVPRKVKKAAAGLYDRTGVYRAAFAASDASALRAVVAKTISGDRVEADAIAAYASSSQSHLAKERPADLLQGHVTFPPV
jgi:cytochrome b pre-mRNA-processing protein 3